MDTLRERLAAAGKMYDGRVTIGSLNEQMKVIEEMFGRVVLDDLRKNTTWGYPSLMGDSSNEKKGA